VGSGNDRRSMVDLHDPDITRFPRFCQARAVECVLHPGEALFIPSAWWHNITQLDEENVSVNFWFERTKAAYESDAAQTTALYRDLEGAGLTQSSANALVARARDSKHEGHEALRMAVKRSQWGRLHQSEEAVTDFLEEMVITRLSIFRELHGGHAAEDVLRGGRRHGIFSVPACASFRWPRPAVAIMYTCAGCKDGKSLEDLQACSRCHSALFCGSTCQRAAWPAHKLDCKPFKSE
jgi:hypothetical protein